MAKTNSTTAAPKSLNFTKESLSALPVTGKRTYHYDTKLPQLGVTVFPSGKKSFHVRATVKGKTTRVTIPNGSYPGMKIEQARRKALDQLHKVAEGINPIQEKREQRAAEVVSELTVDAAVEWFCKVKQRKVKATGAKVAIKESTKNNYRKSIKALLGEKLYAKPMASLGEQDITNAVHEKDKTSRTVAAAGCRALSSVWDWVGTREDYRASWPANPVKAYTKNNEGLHRAPPKNRRIEREELPAFFDAMDDVPPLIAEYFLWLLLTGNRSNEAKQLAWQDIDWRNKTYHLADTKNRIPVDLPVPSSMLVKLKARRQATGLVFPVHYSARSQQDKMGESIGKRWTVHDLRRTFSGIAASVIPYTSVKRLINHTFSDITEQYIGSSADLGEEIDKVQREILRLAGRPLDNVMRLEVVG